MQWITQNSDGEVRALFRCLSSIVRWSFLPVEIKGFVYSPVSSLPSRLLFGAEERQKNSWLKTTRSLRSGFPPHSVRAARSSAAAASGSSTWRQAAMNVRHAGSTRQKNFQDILSLSFAQAVEGMTSLISPSWSIRKAGRNGDRGSHAEGNRRVGAQTQQQPKP